MATTKIIPVSKPEINQKYFCISCSLGGLSVKDDVFLGDSVDFNRLRNYNMFKTHGDAVVILKEIENIFKRLGDNK